jgi:hypothetical protein
MRKGLWEDIECVSGAISDNLAAYNGSNNSLALYGVHRESKQEYRVQIPTYNMNLLERLGWLLFNR